MLIHSAAQLLTLAGGPRRGGDENLAIIENGAVLVRDGRIVDVGESRSLIEKYPHEDMLDASGRVVMPGLVDPHTHLVWAGDRAAEFEARLQGKTYMEIMAAGGGILRTVRDTRAAGERELFDQSAARLRSMVAHGSTTIEAKSGYGLELETELRMLEVIAEASRRHPVDLHPTCLAAHEVPPEHRADPEAWVRRVIEEIHPAVAGRGLAEAVDVFCERGVFSLDQTRRLLADAPRYGWRIHLHADELSPLGGAELAVERGALSADHLMCVTEAGVAALAGSDTVAVLLPGTSFFLRLGYAPARTLIDAGCAVALATDCNPGSSPTQSMPMILALACLGAGMSVAEALTELRDELCGLLQKQSESIGVHDIGDHRTIFALQGIYHGSYDFRMMVTLVGGGIGCQAVEVFLVIEAIQPSTFGFSDDQPQTAIVMGAKSALKIDDLVVGYL